MIAKTTITLRKTINWGIIAPGNIAGKFAQDLQLVNNSRLHAVASRSLERAQAFAKKYGATHAFGSYEEMTKCPDLDVVYIASPHSGHFKHTLLFLEKKIPVLCEKPLAINLSQAKRMVNAARRNDTFLMEAIWTRFLPSFQKMLELLESKKLGQLKVIRADFGINKPFDPGSRLFNPGLGGGSLLDVGIYPVFLATYLWGKPDEIKAEALFSASGTDDLCGMLLRYSDGRMAVLDSAVVADTPTEGFLYGENGYIQLHRRFHEAQSVTCSLEGKEDENFKTPTTGFGYYHEILEVNECLRQGKKESEKLPLDFSLRLMETLDAIRREIGLVYPDFD